MADSRNLARVTDVAEKILSPEQRQRAEALVVAEVVMPEDYTIGELLDVADWVATGSGRFELGAELEKRSLSISASSGMLRKTHYALPDRHDGIAADCWRCRPLATRRATSHTTADGQKHYGPPSGCRFC